MFDIQNLNIIQDDENYYFFRALNMGDENDIETHLTSLDDGSLVQIRTDCARYDGMAKYQEGEPLSLEQAFDHIKIHHRKDTNCISLSSNANVALLYGKSFYKDRYAMIKVPKNKLGEQTVIAGPYMLEEVSKRIEEYRKNTDLDEVTKYYLDAIYNAKDLSRIEEILRTKKEKKRYDDVFQKGVIQAEKTRTDLGDYSDSEKENLSREKILAMLKVIPDEILPNVSNLFLVQTIGNAFSASELLHDGEIKKEELLTLPKELVEVFASLQQLPKDTPYVEKLKREILKAVIENKTIFPLFPYENDQLPEEQDSIKRMYELTKSGTSYYDAIQLYHKMFYLAKSRLRNLHTARILQELTGNNPKYASIIEKVKEEGLGIEPEIFSRAKGNGLSISENVRVGIREKEKAMYEKVMNDSEEQLQQVLQEPEKIFTEFLDKNYQMTENEYYANAVIDLFDWESIGVVPFSIERRDKLVKKLMESDVVGTYQTLRGQGISEKEIVGKLLTAIIKDRKVEEVGEQEVFTTDDLDSFLGYYLIKGTKNFQLKPYQAYAYEEAERLMDEHQFSSVVMPTGSGKSFVAIATMLKNPEQNMLYLAPNEEILNQVKHYLVKYVIGETSSKSIDDTIKEKFPNLRFQKYPDLVSMKQDEIIDAKYDYVILDELHRSGASEWKKKVEKLITNQQDNPNFKMLGITATEERDMDHQDMAEYWARYFNYSEEEIAKDKHIAYYMSLEEAVSYGYVLNPRKVACDYYLASEEGKGLFHELEEKMKEVEATNGNDEKVKQLAAKLDRLRRNVKNAKGVSEIICENVQFGKKYIVFCPVTSDKQQIEDEDGNTINSRKTGAKAIQEEQEKMLEYFQNYFGLSKEEAKESIECYSMLGEYSKSKNARELAKFQQDTQDSKDKIKFMFVMNKLNEGVHLDQIDGIIWLRPLDENSKILYLQQLGRIIHAIDPNHPIPKEDLPIAIDLVGNSLRVKLNKNQKQRDSLEELKAIQGWIVKHNNQIPDINSNDRLEARCASKLKRIQKEYDRYLHDDQLLEKLNQRMKYRIEEILEIGSTIALWNYEFPERTKIDAIEKKIEEDEDLFEIQGYLKDYFDIATELDSYEISAFQKNYQQAMAYYEEHGNLSITRTSGSLGKWISIQRTNYKNLKLTGEQFEALNAIGMIWDAEKNPLAVENLCEENGIPSEQLWRELLSREINDKSEIEKKMKGNNTIPISILELQAKIAYMKDKDISLIQPDGTLYPILAMNSKELISTTGMSLIELEHRYIENPKHVIDNMLKIKIDAFGDNYRQAQAYYEEHGNLNITRISGSLGAWIVNQRINYKNHKLSEEQFEALNAIGMVWATVENQIAVETLCEENGIPSEQLWRELLSREINDKSEIEKKMKGNNTIPISILELQAKIAYMKDKDISLIQPDGTLYPILAMNSKELISTTGMSLIELEHRYIENPKHVIDNMLKIKIDAFGDNYRQAQAYYEEHGNLSITRTSGSLGAWISIQRTNYKNLKLTGEQFEALNAIGMIWDAEKNPLAVENLCEENGIPSEQLWRELLSREINDKSEIEKKMKGNNTIPISILELQAKIAYMKDKDISLIQPDGTLYPILAMNSKELISTTGMSLIELEHRYIENPKHVIDNMLKIKIDAFGDNYRQAQAYYEEHGNLDIKILSGSLGVWIKDQRKQYKKQKSTNEQFEALNAIGMIWATAENQIAVENLCKENNISSEELWRELLSREINDKSEIEKKMKGNNTIPISILELQAKIAYMKDKDISLIQPDGTLYPILAMNSKELISTTGMSLIELEHRYIENPKHVIDNMLKIKIDAFGDNYRQAQAYYEEHGNLDIKILSGSLGAWIKEQRKQYKKQKLSEERVDALNAIGMIWELRKNKEQIEAICASHGITLDKKSPLYKKSATELRCKMAYLESIDVPIFEQNGESQKLNPIFFMSDVDMQEKFHVSMSDLVHTYGKQEGVTK